MHYMKQVSQIFIKRFDNTEFIYTYNTVRYCHIIICDMII